MSADATEIVICNAFFRLSISCSVPKIFAIEVRTAKSPEIAPKSMFSAPFFFGGGRFPQILDLVLKIAPISDHVAKFCGDRPRDRGDVSQKKKTAAKHKGRVALSQRAALIAFFI